MVSVVFGINKYFLVNYRIPFQAIGAFEKVLKVHPNNYETIKILGSLYADPTKPERHDKAKVRFSHFLLWLVFIIKFYGLLGALEENR